MARPAPPVRVDPHALRVGPSPHSSASSWYDRGRSAWAWMIVAVISSSAPVAALTMGLRLDEDVAVDGYF